MNDFSQIHCSIVMDKYVSSVVDKDSYLLPYHLKKEKKMSSGKVNYSRHERYREKF